MGSEALLIYNIKEGFNIYLLLFFATAGNTLGSVVNYYMALKGEDYLLKKRLISEKYILKGKVYFDKYGAWSILLSWLPIIGDTITFVAGILKYDFKKFLILVIIAKFSRYLFLVLIV
jgi:membrane protein YqaA with SNARE-associated domain